MDTQIWYLDLRHMRSLHGLIFMLLDSKYDIKSVSLKMITKLYSSNAKKDETKLYNCQHIFWFLGNIYYNVYIFFYYDFMR